ncbi:MAG TPA: cytochrome c oxidase subunit 3 [Anaerolineae bacterium]
MSEAVVTHEHTAEIEEAGSVPGVSNRKFGMWLFIASEVMFFTALIGMFLAYRGQPSAVDFHSRLDIPLTAVNTFVLLTSSLTVVLSLAAAQAGNKRMLTVWLLATVILGSAFVSIQAVEYSRLGADGFVLATSVGTSTFFVLTGFHGLHVILGVLWCLVVMLRAARGGFSKENNVGVELFGLYWHFVDVVWIILFTVIYLL